jgi:hypothetical protein
MSSASIRTALSVPAYNLAIATSNPGGKACRPAERPNAGVFRALDMARFQARPYDGGHKRQGMPDTSVMPVTPARDGGHTGGRRKAGRRSRRFRRSPILSSRAAAPA